METETSLKNGNKTNLFVKGNPGGPGRPKGQLNFNTIFDKAIKRVAKEKNMRLTDVEIIAVAIKKILYGDFKFYKDTMDRRFGSTERGTEVNVDNRKVEISWQTKCPKCGYNYDDDEGASS